jgi:hypothetical protein
VPTDHLALWIFLLLSVATWSGCSSGPRAIPVWRCGFEEGLDHWSWPGGGCVESDQVPEGRVNAYAFTKENALVGDRCYKAWIIDRQHKSHRPYPCQHLEVPSPIVNSWYVWLDVDPKNFNRRTWVHFATWCNSIYGPGLHTMAVRGPKLELEMAHCRWKWVGPDSMRTFPLRRWVRFTYYAHFRPAGDGRVWVWMDGTLIFEARVRHSDQNFQRVHWGLYASGDVDNGVQYNDDIQLWRLAEPWTDRDVEPRSPYGPYVEVSSAEPQADR